MEKHGYDKLVRHHMDKRHAHRHGKYHQTEIDREHEKMGMEHHRAGNPHGDHNRYSERGSHDYDRSRKHREREAEGMKKYHREHHSGY